MARPVVFATKPMKESPAIDWPLEADWDLSVTLMVIGRRRFPR
jgi:hypothetical protein